MNWNSVKEGSRYTNSKGEEYIIIQKRFIDKPVSKNRREILILFPQSGNYEVTHNGFIGTDRVFDHSKPYLLGVGYITGTKQSPVRTWKEDAFLLWYNIMNRCYSKGTGIGSYKKVSVCKDWHDYAKFRSWYEQNKPAHFKDLFCRRRFALDKDLFSTKEEHVYSPRTCCFLPSKLNSYVTILQRIRRGEEPDDMESFVKNIQELIETCKPYLTRRVISKLNERVRLASECV